MIFKATSKTGSLGSCFFCMNIGSSNRLAMQNLHIPKTAETKIVPNWLFQLRFSDENMFYLQPSGCCTGCSHIRENKKATD